MAARKFKFVSPGVFLKEVDQSQLPRLPGNIGPVIIGRTRKGPALRPTLVNSYEEFVEIFGEPVPGNQGEDVWRDGNGLLAPAYAHYAAKAYFAAGIDSPVTVVRLLGVAGDNAGAGGVAGWEATKAHGLFVYSDGALNGADVQLAAIFYATEENTAFGLSGTKSDGSTPADGVVGDVVLDDSANDGRLTLKITDNAGTTSRSVEIDFTKGSKHYIRDVLNTNPVMTNSSVATANSAMIEGEYWLGETFDETIPSGDIRAFILPLTDNKMEDFNSEATAGRTGWIVSQDEASAGDFDVLEQSKLFRAIALSEGEEFSKNYIVAIEDIRVPDTGEVDAYGTFSVVVKQRFGTRLETVESFTGCNLNPNSQNYVARQVGDQFVQWSSTEKRNKIYGNYPNRSRYIRVEMDSNVDSGLTSPSKVPFGFLGPIVMADIAVTLSSGDADINSTSFVSGTAVSSSATGDAAAVFTLQWPALPTTVNASTRGADYFGAAVFKKNGDDLTSQLDYGMIDYVRMSAVEMGRSAQISGEAGSTTTHAFLFSLDDVVLTGDTLSDLGAANVETAVWTSGSRAGGTSFTATSGSKNLLDLGFNQFWMPLVGGFDGVEVTEADPFNNRVMLNAGTDDSYAYASVDRAIELIKDPEAVEFNLAAMPGITNTSLTTKLVQTCESRADAMAIIDLPDVYKPAHEYKCTGSVSERIGTTPINAAKSLKERALNSSYGATYYPWVKIADTENTRELWAPPSVVALGVMAYTEKRDEVWFAPAGFNRGGLNEGNAGIPVLQVSEQLLSKQRDTLYEANINPIASFVTEGLVVFGQKTLQSTPSALDRINVRRLLIFVKKEVSRIASSLLFDQNVPATWNRFLGQVNPFLQSVKTRLGLSDFKVILDNTTTTPDLIDRNIMYAKIFLKPARSIEFIAVDFVITNTGASFDD
jgi:hypothetical protein